MIKGHNELKPKAVDRPGIFLTVKANSGKPQIGDHPMKTVDQSSPQMGSLTPNEIGRIA